MVNSEMPSCVISMSISISIGICPFLTISITHTKLVISLRLPSTMTSEFLPESHPLLDASTPGARCPVTGYSHDFIAPKEGDSRSPCPALNAMANHGYM